MYRLLIGTELEEQKQQRDRRTTRNNPLLSSGTNRENERRNRDLTRQDAEVFPIDKE